MNMIQWLQSKIVLIAVVVIMISSVTTFFYYQIGELEEQELEGRGRKLSRIITDMQNSGVDEMSQRVTFHEENDGIYLSPEVNGDPYDMEITTGYLRLKQDGTEKIIPLNTNIHLWEPGMMNHTGYLSPEEMEWRDGRESSLELRAGDVGLKLISLRLYDGSAHENHIFIREVPSS